MATEDYPGAVIDFTKVIEFNSNFATAFYQRGRAKSKLSDYYGAIEDYSRAIDITPKFANAYLNRAKAKKALNQIQQSEKDLKIYNSLSGINDDNQIIF